MVPMAAPPEVLPGFIVESVAPGPTLPEPDAPGAGWVWAQAIAVAPNREAKPRLKLQARIA